MLVVAGFDFFGSFLLAFVALLVWRILILFQALCKADYKGVFGLRLEHVKDGAMTGGYLPKISQYVLESVNPFIKVLFRIRPENHRFKLRLLTLIAARSTKVDHEEGKFKVVWQLNFRDSLLIEPVHDGEVVYLKSTDQAFDEDDLIP